MNENVIESVAVNLNIKVDQIKSVLEMLSEGATIPFIARYRKEKTGGLDEDQIRSIEEVYQYQTNLYNRKLDVIRLIEEKDLMTDELRKNILACEKLAEVEDLYRPFKEKKKTKATDAINNGLEPLAKMIMTFPTTGSLQDLAKKFVNDKVKDEKEALEGASYIIAEWISDNAYYRKWIRNNVFHTGFITSKIKKDAIDELKTFERYYNYQELIKTIKHYRVLAINRGEDKKVLSVGIDYDMEAISNYLESKIIKNPASFVTELVKNSIKDSLKRLIMPSI